MNMKRIAGISKNHIGFTIIGILLIWIASVVAATYANAITKPFTLDETDISSRADFVLERGPEIFNDGTHYFAHPPLYEYTAVLIFKIFGQGEIPLRSFGILCHLLSGLFLMLSVRLALKDIPKSERICACVLFFVLFLMNPTLLQHSMSIDADTTEIMLFVCMYVYGFIRSESLTGKAFLLSRLGLSAVFALAFLSKEITPILLAVSMSGYRLVNRQWKRLFADLILIHAMGTLIAWSLWWGYCFFTSTDPLVFIKYTLIKKTPRAANSEHLLRILQDLPRMMRWTVYWLGAPLCLLAVMTGLQQTVRFARSRQLEISAILLLAGIGIYCPYIIAKPAIDMMKYQHPAFALITAFVCIGIFRSLQSRGISVSESVREHPVFVLFGAVFVVGLTVYYSGLGDYILILWDKGMTDRWKSFLFSYYKPFLFGAFGFSLYALWRRRSIFAYLILLLILMQASINVSLNMNQQTDYVTAESWMNYGESGHRDVIRFFLDNADDRHYITSRKDISYYLKAHHGREFKTFDIRKIFVTQDPKVLDSLFRSGNIKYIMFDKISLLGFTQEIMRPGLLMMSKYYRLVLDAGSFKIYGYVS